MVWTMIELISWWSGDSGLTPGSPLGSSSSSRRWKSTPPHRVGVELLSRGSSMAQGVRGVKDDIPESWD